MNTKILDYFIAIAEEKSITRAAERFFLTDSALSKHVRNLEKELGAPIFHYDRDGMHLTAEGVIFINNAQAIRHLEREMERKLSDLSRQSSNLIRVATDESYYNCVVREIMPSFYKAYPDHTVELCKCNASQVRQLLLADKADFGVLSSTDAKLPELESTRIMTNRVFLAYPPGYEGDLGVEGIRTALDSGLIPIMHPVGNTVRMLEEQRLVELQLYPENILEGTYLNALQEIQNGRGMSFLPEGICEVYRPRGLVIGGEFMRFNTLMAYLPNRMFSDACRNLMERMLRVISGGGLLTPYRSGKNGALAKEWEQGCPAEKL